jgi:hypothetical protein
MKTETMTSIQEQIQIILEQNETELTYRAIGIDPVNYPTVAEKIVELIKTIQNK